MFDSQSEAIPHGSAAYLERVPTLTRPAQRPPQPQRPAGRPISLQDPAARVMTDFTTEAAVTVAPGRLIDDALRDMMVAGVRALLVVRGEIIVGLITSYDIQGERPLQFLMTSGFTRHDEIEVGHIMTPWEKVPALDAQWIASAQVADVVRTFKAGQASHMVVVEYGGPSPAVVRGLFSRARLERQLGQSV